MERKIVEPSRPPTPQLAPWLVFFSHGNRGKAQTFYSISEGRSYVRSVKSMRQKVCHACFRSWMFMEEWDSQACFLLNCTSMEMIQLPDLPPPSGYSYSTSDCIITAPPSDPDCVVFFADRRRPVILYWHRRLHHDEWRKAWFKIEDEGGLWNLVVCNRKVYALTFNETLATVAFDPCVTVRLIGVALPDYPFLRVSNWIDLVESCGEVFALHVVFADSRCDLVVTIVVSKLDSSEMKWVQVESIGDRAFFLSKGNAAVSCSASEASNIIGNSIYYVCPEDQTLYRFDMADRSVTMDQPCRNLASPWSQPHWVLPSQQ